MDTIIPAQPGYYWLEYLHADIADLRRAFRCRLFADHPKVDDMAADLAATLTARRVPILAWSGTRGREFLQPHVPYGYAFMDHTTAVLCPDGDGVLAWRDDRRKDLSLDGGRWTERHPDVHAWVRARVFRTEDELEREAGQ